MLHVLCDLREFCIKLYYFVCADWSLGCLHPSLYASSADAGKIVLMVYTKRNLLEIYDNNYTPLGFMENKYTLAFFQQMMETNP